VASRHAFALSQEVEAKQTLLDQLRALVRAMHSTTDIKLASCN
jgi:hypothetical protein